MKNLKLTGIFWHEGSSVVSKCPELGVASCGSSVEEAMANLREAVELYLENARALGLADGLAAFSKTEQAVQKAS